MKNYPSLPLIKLPLSTQAVLLLIREELKSRKLFRNLRKAGLDDCYYQPHLDVLIMQSIGLDDNNDQTFGAYNEILERRSRKIVADNDAIMKQVMRVYCELAKLKETANTMEPNR